MPMIEVECAYCGNKIMRKQYEVKRNERLGRANCCSRTCQASHMNKSEKKKEAVRLILAERNGNQYAENNPNWKGGSSPACKLKTEDSIAHLLDPAPRRLYNSLKAGGWLQLSQEDGNWYYGHDHVCEDVIHPLWATGKFYVLTLRRRDRSKLECYYILHDAAIPKFIKDRRESHELTGEHFVKTGEQFTRILVKILPKAGKSK